MRLGLVPSDIFKNENACTEIIERRIVRKEVVLMLIYHQMMMGYETENAFSS
jgi:hypothetical protein